MAAISEIVHPQRFSQNGAEENSYFKRAVLAVTSLVRTIFEKIAVIFSFFFISLNPPRQAKPENLIEPDRDPLPKPPSPRRMSVQEENWERFKSYISPQECLDLFNGSKVTQQERDSAYLSHAEEARKASCSAWRVLSSWIKGSSREQKIAEGKQMVQNNPDLIIPFLRKKS